VFFFCVWVWGFLRLLHSRTHRQNVSHITGRSMPLLYWRNSVAVRPAWLNELVSQTFTWRWTPFFWNMMPRRWLIRSDISSSTVLRSEKNYLTLLRDLTPCLTLWGHIALLHDQTAWLYCITSLVVFLHDLNLRPCSMTVLRTWYWKEYIITTRVCRKLTLVTIAFVADPKGVWSLVIRFLLDVTTNV
jgi:hypothetical protein